MLKKLKTTADQMKAETLALYLAARDPRTPWHASLVLAVVAAYALSPIDLIPDFVPVIGYLDDVVLVPIGIALTIKLVPASVLVESRVKAKEIFQSGQPVSRAAALLIILIWILVAAALAWWAISALSGTNNGR